VYPFLFDARTFDRRVEAIEQARWTSKRRNSNNKECEIWKADRFPKDDMLAYVASYLNPPAGTKATARLWQLNDELENVYGLGERAEWQLQVKEDHSPTFRASDFKNLAGLLDKLRLAQDPLSQHLHETWPQEQQTLLEFAEGTRTFAGEHQKKLIETLNELLKRKPLFDEKRFAHIQLTDKARRAIGQNFQGDRVAQVNRLLLEEAYPEEINPHEQTELIPFIFGEGGEKGFTGQLALFRDGVGLFSILIKPKTRDLGDWLSVLSAFRYVNRPRSVRLWACSAAGKNERNQKVYQPFFPEPAGGLGEHPDGSGVFDDLLNAFLQTGRLDEDATEWWRDVFVPEKMIPFAVLFVDDAPVEQDLELAYKVRNFFLPHQGKTPAPDDLRTDHPSLLTYDSRQWFIFSLDGGAFLACDAPQRDFFRRTLPEHLRNQYFIIFLLALHQRFLLMSLSQQVSDHWLEADDAARTHAFESIRDTLLEFAARGQFTQIMQRENHHRCYRKWQEVFQLKDLYTEVRDEVREMHDYLQTRRAERIKQLAEERKLQMEAQLEAEKAREREARALADALTKDIEERERTAQERAGRLERIIGLLGICFGVPTLVISFLNINIQGITTNDEGLRFWLALAVVSGLSVFFISAILLLLRQYIKEAIKLKIDQQQKEAKEKEDASHQGK
jgi:hypothetical protein